MLRVPTDRKGEFVTLKHFRFTTPHLDLLERLINDCERDRDLRNLTLPIELPGNRAATIPIFRLVFDRREIHDLNPEER